MSIGCNMLDFIVLRGEINDFGVFEGKSTVVRVMGVRMTVVCNSVASVVVFLSQPMGVGVGAAAVTSWDADDDVVSKIAVYFDILGD